MKRMPQPKVRAEELGGKVQEAPTTSRARATSQAERAEEKETEECIERHS